jgi:ABC-type Fe3+ transport system substrate-binding protein
MVDGRFDPNTAPESVQDDARARANWEARRAIYLAYRATDDPAAFSCQIDLFFGGGAYDHGKAAAEGLTVPPWAPGAQPEDTLFQEDGRELAPLQLSGEVWRTDTFFATALSTFGLCYNPDRLRELGIASPPHCWRDLTDPRYRGQVGLADPTKSGSIAKAFEMIIHAECLSAVKAAGFTLTEVDRFEGAIRQARLAPGEMPEGVPVAYQAAVAAGWLEGLRLVQRISANARYFTDSATKVPIDVSVGDAAAGLAIDFYGRFQAEHSRAPDGSERMIYVTPSAGSSVSADPISLIRGAEHRELAVRFMTFMLREAGQRLWCYAPGTPGGPEKFSLRRLPARRDFYPAEAPDAASRYEHHRPYLVDALGDPEVNPYVLAGQFVYQPRWTGQHFNIQRDLIRAMCMDAGDELRRAWGAIIAAGGPEQQPEAMALLERLPTVPDPVTWATALHIPREHDRLDYMREWTLFFRKSYAEAEATARNPERRTPNAELRTLR